MMHFSGGTGFSVWQHSPVGRQLRVKKNESASMVKNGRSGLIRVMLGSVHGVDLCSCSMGASQRLCDQKKGGPRLLATSSRTSKETAPVKKKQSQS